MRHTELELASVRRRNLEEQIYDTLREAILVGRLAGGERLTQGELAAQLATSRIPVRAAVARDARAVEDRLARHIRTAGRSLQMQLARPVRPRSGEGRRVSGQAAAREPQHGARPGQSPSGRTDRDRSPPHAGPGPELRRYLLAGDVRAYEQFVGGPAHKRKLIIGSVSHAAAPDSLPHGNAEYQAMWLDRFLKGIKNGVDTEPRVLLRIEGPNQWRFEHSWPIPDTRWARLHLRAAMNGDGTSINDGTLTPEKPRADEAAVSYDYSPGGPFNAAGANGPRLTDDQRPDEALGLTWTSAPLQVPTEVTGWWHLTFWASATAADTDFVVEVTDVAPDGASTQIGRGWLNASRSRQNVIGAEALEDATGPANPQPLVPGQVYPFAVEIWPTAYVFPAGHRIRIALFGSDSLGTAPNPIAATVAVYQDAAHPSHVEIPIIGASAWRALLGKGDGATKPKE